MPNYSSIYLELQALWREQQSVNAAIGGVKGDQTTATGQYAHAQGYQTTASGDYSHAEGLATKAYGDFSHAEGYVTTAYGEFASHAEGLYTIASASFQHVQGVYNQTSSTALMLVGNGSGPASANRSNILEVYSDRMVVSGNIVLPSNTGITFSDNGINGSPDVTLSDYESGDWTLAADGTYLTISGATGKYTKIGRVMHIWGRFTCVTFINKSGYITGLPALVSGGSADIITNGSMPVSFTELDSTSSRADIFSGYLQYSSMRLYVPTLTPAENYSFYCAYFTNY